MLAGFTGGVEGVLVGVVGNVAEGDIVAGTVLLVTAGAIDETVALVVTVPFWEETVPVKIIKNYYTDKQILKKDDYFKMTKNIQATLEDINSLASV